MADAGERPGRVGTAAADASLFLAADGRQELVRLNRRVAVQRRARLVQRALRMGPAEWLDRGRALLGGAPVAETMPATLRMDAGAVAAALGERFPLAPAHTAATVRWWRAEASADAAALTATARTIADEGVLVFGERVSLRDGAFAWSVDPVSGRCWWPSQPLDEASAVAAVQEAGGAVDVKRVWEPGRHQFLAPLAAAAQVADTPAWADLAARTLESWLAQNPPGLGIHWASPLEIGLRALAWLWAMPWLLGSPALSSSTTQAWVDSLAAHYQILRGRVSRFTDPTNHLLGEATAVWILATVFPTLPDAAVEAARCLDLLTVEVARQVAPDGVSEEQATGYHAFVLEFLLQIVAVARAAGVTLPPVIAARAAAMVTVLDAVVGRGGSVPQLGDWDDGRAMPCFVAEDWRTRMDGLVSVGGGLLGVPVRAGRYGAPAWARIMGAAPASTDAPVRSQVFRDGGLAVFDARPASGGAVHAVVHVGGFGALANAGHAHADVLSLVLRVNDVLLLADPGCGAYTGPTAVRETFRATRLHNTVTVDDLSQADPLDTFKWLNLPAVRLHAWQSTARVDLVAASHDGYARLRRPVWHRRDVVFVRPHYLAVVDRFLGVGSHRLARRFVLPPDATATAHAGGASIAGADGTGLAVILAGGEAASACRVVPVPWSPGYGRWQSSLAIEAVCDATTPATLLALLIPSGPGLSDVRCIDAGTPALTDGVLDWSYRLVIDGEPVDEHLAIAAPAAGQRDAGQLAAVEWQRRRADGSVVNALTAGDHP